MVLTGEFIAIAAANNRNWTAKRPELEQQVRELEEIHKRSGALLMFGKLNAVRAQLQHLDFDRAEYAALHLKHKHYIGGNKSGRTLARKLRAKITKERVRVCWMLGG